MAETEQSFEAMTKELEDILLILERGERPLEEMLRLYARGVELIGLCRTRLNAAEETLRIDAATPALPNETEQDEQSSGVDARNQDTLFKRRLSRAVLAGTMLGKCRIQSGSPINIMMERK